MINSTSKFGFLLINVLLATGLLSSCLKENFDDCPRPFQLFIKAIDADRNDITSSGEVERVILFIFDELGEIVDAFELNNGQIINREPVNIMLDYPGHKSLSLIAWGNVDESVYFPQSATVKELSDLYVRLKSISVSKSGTPLVYSPGDLFFGSLIVPIEYGGLEPSDDQTITITRKTSQITISAFSLIEFEKEAQGVYTFELHESKNSYDEKGKLIGDMVAYQPITKIIDNNGPVETNPQNDPRLNGHLIAPIFRTFPTTEGQAYKLYILYNGEIIYVTDKDSEGNPFICEPGRLLNIIIHFNAEVTTKSIVTPWDQVFQYVEF